MTTLYMDLISQPARACVLFCRVNNIQVTERVVSVMKVVSRDQEFRNINPTGKIPCLQEDEFVLPESAAILRYLASSKGAPDYWYPKDYRYRAKVDSALDWYHGNVRQHAIILIWHVVGKSMKPNPMPISDGLAKRALAGLKVTLQTLEEYWLAHTLFLAGNEVSIADLLHGCEMDQLCMLDSADQGPTFEELLQPFPKVQQWLVRVADSTEPHWTTATAVLRKVAQRGRDAKLKAPQAKL